MYLLAAPIFKCLDSTTQRIIVDTRGSSHRLHPGDHAILFDMIRFVVQHRTGIQLAAIYLVGMEERLMLGTVKDTFRSTQCAMHAADRPRARRYAVEGYEFLLNDFVASWKNCPCVAIYLVHCYVHLEYGGKRLVIPVPAARLTMPDNDGCALWDALDAALPVLSDRQLNKMARWLGDHDPLSAAFRMIRKMVCAVQTADPWPSLHYRGKQWCVDGLKGVQLHRLSRITLHFLLELTKFPEFRDSGFPANPSAWCQPGQFVLDD
ncbi:uncharacterized protein LOC129598837 [Paramacrobiotus metropolitanus]|uniref:uncharacterized protein LOC129598837 n=1 Tax=Paramacrobiotus metropolitanus TaxID=2943436 RepID=UPI002445974B|nr:uncharacterized protein LOC129598837 [Paramacrobiotus metropolitanus]